MEVFAGESARVVVEDDVVIWVEITRVGEIDAPPAIKDKLMELMPEVFNGANGIKYTASLPTWFNTGLDATSLQLTGLSLGQDYTLEFEASGERWNVCRFSLGTDEAGNIVDDFMFTINWGGYIYIDGSLVVSQRFDNGVNHMFSFISADCTLRYFKLTIND